MLEKPSSPEAVQKLVLKKGLLTHLENIFYLSGIKELPKYPGRLHIASSGSLSFHHNYHLSVAVGVFDQPTRSNGWRCWQRQFNLYGNFWTY